MKKAAFFAILCFICFEVFGQRDTSKQDGYIPLFDNLTTPDEPLQGDYNGKLRTINADNDSIHSISEAMEILKTLYKAGRFRDAFGVAIYVRQKLETEKISKSDKNDFHIYSIAALKEMGYDRHADSLMKIFCNQSPFYKVIDNDPSAFVKLKDKFVTRPWLSVRMSVSKIFPVIVVDTIYTTRSSSYSYSEIKAATHGADIVFYPTKNLEISVGATYSTFSYKRLESGTKLYFSYAESNKFYGFPLEIGYSLPEIIKNTITPEVYLGAKYTRLFKSEYKTRDLRRTDLYVSDKIDTVNYSGSFKDVKNSYISLFGGVRLNYCYKMLVAYVGLHYGFALKELRKPENKYKNTDLILNHKFIPEAIRVNQIALNFGLKINLFYKTTSKYGYGYY